MHAFPWREEESLVTGQVILRPTVDVRLRANNQTIAAKALVDTGAPRCVFPRGVGDLLCVEFPQFGSECDRKLSVLGRDWPAVAATVQLALEPFADQAWDAEVFFVLDEGLPLALLGYEGFLNRWAVSFDAYHGYFLVEPVESFHERHDGDAIVDELQRRLPQGPR